MKKVLSLVAAGAMLLSVAGIVSARGRSVNQKALTVSITGAVSVSGGNTQSGNGKEVMFTGNSDSTVQSKTAGNSKQNDLTGSVTVAGSVSGGNTQTGHYGSSTQVMTTGSSTSTAGSVTISNVSFNNF